MLIYFDIQHALQQYIFTDFILILKTYLNVSLPSLPAKHKFIARYSRAP